MGQHVFFFVINPPVIMSGKSLSSMIFPAIGLHGAGTSQPCFMTDLEKVKKPQHNRWCLDFWCLKMEDLPSSMVKTVINCHDKNDAFHQWILLNIQFFWPLNDQRHTFRLRLFHVLRVSWHDLCFFQGPGGVRTSCLFCFTTNGRGVGRAKWSWLRPQVGNCNR